jgi:hypothetical protein
MKRLLLLLAAIPSLAVAVPVNLDGPNTDFSAFTSSGYRVEHSASADPSSGLNRWWVSFFSPSDAGFDAFSFGGAMQSLIAGSPAAVLVQGETMNGDLYSQIFRFKPGMTEGALLTADLNGEFRNLSWLRISGFGSGSDFALKDFQVSGVESVPDASPSLFLMALAFGSLLIARVGLNRLPRQAA